MNFEQQQIENKVKESISIRDLINELQEKSKYEREELPDGDERIKNKEGEEYLVKLLTDPEDSAVGRLHAYMLKEFGEEETIPLGWLKKIIKEKTSYHHIIEAKNNEIAAYVESEYLEIGEEKEGAIFLCYMEVNKDFARKAFAPELRQNAYKELSKVAQSRGQQIKYVVGETVGSAERYANRMGSKRIYFEKENGDIQEVEYYCPPIDYDSETGERLALPKPEHLTLLLTDKNQSLSCDKLLQIIKQIYEEYVASEDCYESKEAYEKAHQDAMNLLKTLEEGLKEAQEKKVFLMSIDERKKMRESGKIVEDLKTGK